MEKKQGIRRNNQDFILKILFIILISGLITYIFPREGKFKYDIRKGRRWLQKELVAPFDFGIQKSE
ncbi:MAG: hypothetical protein KKA07_03155, partial [Bacteroidetes bacterium]|nr:hypothetical protein [Bacteroidota bacterium]